MVATIKFDKREITAQHHTENYDWTSLVVRRGFEFNIQIESNVAFDLSESVVNLTLINGKIRVLYYFVTANQASDGPWNIKCTQNSDKSFILTFISTADAAIGEYLAKINFGTAFSARVNFVLLFNPWFQDDDTFLQSEVQCEEYVLNDTTIIYTGSIGNFRPSSWFLGQFLDTSMTTALILINRISPKLRHNVVEFTRFISALVNSNDDDGILVGRWDGNYDEGINPNAWNDSADILRKYARDMIPVKYGQCWVYAGVMCSLFRAYGIPSRCITNFDSFHDKDKSVRWEVYLDEYNKVIPSNEKIWNYHAWTEAWMKRKTPEFSGWQILDATPQERSGSIFCLGPSPRYAVKEGLIKEEYDVNFVFAEVNADKVIIKKDENGANKVISVHRHDVGKFISTKAVGSDTREDVTLDYKYPDGSTKEEEIQRRICQLVGRSVPTYSSNELQLEVPDDIVCVLGEDFKCKFGVSMKEDDFKTLTYKVSIVSQSSILLAVLTEDSIEMTSNTWKKEFVFVADDILKGVRNEMCFLKFEFVGCCKSDSILTNQKHIPITSEMIQIDADSAATVDSSYKFSIRLINPLSNALHDTKIYVSSSCIKSRIFRRIGLVNAKSILKLDFQFVPRKTGSHHVSASLASSELAGYHKTHNFVVE